MLVSTIQEIRKYKNVQSVPFFKPIRFKGKKKKSPSGNTSLPDTSAPRGAHEVCHSHFREHFTATTLNEIKWRGLYAQHSSAQNRRKGPALLKGVSTTFTKVTGDVSYVLHISSGSSCPGHPFFLSSLSQSGEIL